MRPEEQPDQEQNPALQSLPSPVLEPKDFTSSCLYMNSQNLSREPAKLVSTNSSPPYVLNVHLPGTPHPERSQKRQQPTRGC